jgi:hypothetical protein
MTIKELSLPQKVEFIRSMMGAVRQFREETDSYLNGARESWEYQPDIHWYEAYGIKQALVILCGENDCVKLSSFLTCFNELTNDIEAYSDDDLLQILLDAFDVDEMEVCY